LRKSKAHGEEIEDEEEIGLLGHEGVVLGGEEQIYFG